MVGLGLEALSLLAYFELTRSLIPKSEDPGLATVSRIQLSTLALSHCVPGGNAAASTLSYRLLTRAGVGGTDTAFALASQGLGSAVVLNVIFWLALVASLPIYGFRVAYLFVAVLGLMLMAFIAGLVILMTKGDERAMKFVNAIGDQAAFHQARDPGQVLRPACCAVQAALHGPSPARQGVFFASANWLLTPRPSSSSWAHSAAGSTRSLCSSPTVSPTLRQRSPLPRGSWGIRANADRDPCRFRPAQGDRDPRGGGLEARQLLAAHPRRRYQLPVAACPPAGGEPGWPCKAEGRVARPLALGC